MSALPGQLPPLSSLPQPQAPRRRRPCRLLSPPSNLGSRENPLILSLPPSANSQEQIDAAKVIAAQFTERTGYTVVTVIPDSYSDLVDSLAKGNAHIVLLDPYAYELAFQRNLVRASYAVLQNGERKYGAQFLARRRAGFSSYFDEGLDKNTTEDPAVALAQFADKKPCWSDETSASGYVIPLGYLNGNSDRDEASCLCGGPSNRCAIAVCQRHLRLRRDLHRRA